MRHYGIQRVPSRRRTARRCKASQAEARPGLAWLDNTLRGKAGQVTALHINKWFAKATQGSHGLAGVSKGWQGLARFVKAKQGKARRAWQRDAPAAPAAPAAAAAPVAPRAPTALAAPTPKTSASKRHCQQQRSLSTKQHVNQNTIHRIS